MINDNDEFTSVYIAVRLAGRLFIASRALSSHSELESRR